MNLQELVPVITNKIKNGNISVSSVVDEIPQLYTLTKQFPDAISIPLGNASVAYKAKEQRIELSAVANWQELDLKFLIFLQNSEYGPVTGAKIILPKNHPLTIPGLTWFELRDASISLQTVPPKSPGALLTRGYIHSLYCQLVVNDIVIPLIATYTSSNGVSLKADLSNVSLPSISQIANLVGGNHNLSLPDAFNTLGGIRLTSLGLTVGEGLKGTNTLKKIEVGIGTSQAWELIPGIFSIEGIDVNVSLTNPLTTGRSFGGSIAGTLKIGGVVAILEAIKSGQDAPWTFRAKFPELNLSDLAQKALKEFNLQIDLPTIAFKDTEIEIEPSSGAYSFRSTSADNTQWRIPLGVTNLDITGLAIEASKKDTLQGKITGTASLFGSTVKIEASLTDQLKISVTITQVNLTAIVRELLSDLEFPSEIPDVIFDTVMFSITPATKEFTLSAASTEDWRIPLGVTGLLIEEIKFSVNRTKTTGNQYKTTGMFSGKATLGPVSFSLDYKFPGDFTFMANIPSIDLSPAIQDLCGPESLIDIAIPTSTINLKLEDITIKASPTNKFISISGSSAFGKSEVMITRNEQGKWLFMVAYAPPVNWKFSSIDTSLSVLDGLKFSNTALIISTAPDQNTPITIVTLPKSVSLVKGLNFFASMDMTGLGVDDLMNIRSITVSTSIGLTPASLKLSAGLEGSFKITETIAMGDMKFFLRPAPSNFELGISGAVMAKLDSSDLRFVGSMAIRPIERSAAFAATMLGTWKEPFGVKGLSVGNVAIEVGIGIIPPPAVIAPIVGLAGTIGIGSFEGSAAVKFDTATPSKSMIAASFNRLYLKEVIQSFCDAQVYNGIPTEIRNTVLSVGMEDVQVYVVPQPTTIGELFYEAGFKFQGKLSIANFNAEFVFLLDYSKGFLIKATMDPINIENVFKVTGSGGLPGPVIDVDLRLGGSPHVTIAGKVELLEISSEVFVSISDQGFLFFLEGNIFGLFGAKLKASGTDFKNGGNFYLLVELRNDFTTYVRDKAVAGIQEAASGATHEIENAQRDIQKAQNDVNSLDRQIEDMRRTILAERERDARNVKSAEDAVTAAQNEVNKLQATINDTRATIQAERNRDSANVKKAEDAVAAAQNEVNRLQREIDSVRNTIRGERDRDTQNLRDAQNKVSSAQGTVNSLQGEINSTYDRISQLNRDIDNKRRWFDNSAWYEKTYRWAEFSAYATAKGLEITGLYTKIGGLETAKGTANLALEAAKQFLRGIEAGAKTFPIDADPRIIGLFTAKESANLVLEGAKKTLEGIRATINYFPIEADPRMVGLYTAKGAADLALEGAKQTLRGLQLAIKNFPVEADPRMVGLYTAKGTATAALQASILFLEGVKKSVGGLAQVAEFIVTYGLGGLLDIKAAKFEGQLNVVKGGSVSMMLMLSLMQKDMDLSLSFNFKDPLKGIEDLVGKLVDKIK